MIDLFHSLNNWSKQQFTEWIEKKNKYRTAAWGVGGWGGVICGYFSKMASCAVEGIAHQVITIHLITQFINCYEEKTPERKRDLRVSLLSSSTLSHVWLWELRIEKGWGPPRPALLSISVVRCWNQLPLDRFSGLRRIYDWLRQTPNVSSSIWKQSCH